MKSSLLKVQKNSHTKDSFEASGQGPIPIITSKSVQNKDTLDIYNDDEDIFEEILELEDFLSGGCSCRVNLGVILIFLCHFL